MLLGHRLGVVSGCWPPLRCPCRREHCARRWGSPRFRSRRRPRPRRPPRRAPPWQRLAAGVGRPPDAVGRKAGQRRIGGRAGTWRAARPLLLGGLRGYHRRHAPTRTALQGTADRLRKRAGRGPALARRLGHSAGQNGVQGAGQGWVALAGQRRLLLQMLESLGGEVLGGERALSRPAVHTPQPRAHSGHWLPSLGGPSPVRERNTRPCRTIAHPR